MTISDILNTNVGVTAAFAATWAAAVWAYRKNTEDHNALGNKVDDAKSEMLESVRQLGEKIDAVREAITHHETVWHAPKQSRTTTKVAARKKK